MNITFLVGNGFDIAAGIDTSYNLRIHVVLNTEKVLQIKLKSKEVLTEAEVVSVS